MFKISTEQRFNSSSMGFINLKTILGTNIDLILSIKLEKPKKYWTKYALNYKFLNNKNFKRQNTRSKKNIGVK